MAITIQQKSTTASFAIISLLMVLSLIGCQSKEKVNTRPNIIYILADDLGYGDLGAYGQEKIKTPHIDKMAAEGLLFTRHYAGSTVCAPSRASLLTGMHTGVFWVWVRPSPCCA